jgi:hypothetical protein
MLGTQFHPSSARVPIDRIPISRLISAIR